MEAIPNMDEAEQLYNRNRKALLLLERIALDARKQDYEGVNRSLMDLIACLDKWMKEVVRFACVFSGEVYFPDIDSISLTMKQLIEAQKRHDFVLLADYLELSLKPLLNRVFEGLRVIYKNGFFELPKLKEIPECLKAQEEELLKARAYVLEETSSGFPTFALHDELGSYYLHSNGNPVLEAETLARQYYKPEIEEYLVYGAGLGYHINALLSMGDDIRVVVYECDIRVLCTVLSYQGWKRYFDSKRLTLLYDPDLSKLALAMNETDERGIMIHAPSIRNCHVPDSQEALKLYFAKESGLRKTSSLLKANFYRNVKNCIGSVDDIRDKIMGKTVVIVAAGPSFSKNAQYLKELPEGTVILAVTTIYRKLLDMGIRPDFVIHSDAQKKTYSHLSEIHQQIPLLVLSTAYEGCARCYPGASYLICQKDYDLAETYAKEHQLNCYETGGSVATVALSVAVELLAKRVIFVGLDLAYTDGLAHAKGVSGQMPGNMDAVKVPGYHGGMVSSSLIFADFIRWFSNYIRSREGKICEVINATEGGAQIEGMKQMPLVEALKL